MALKIDATFEGKLTSALKNDMRNLANFHHSMLESLKIMTLTGYFYLKQKMYKLKIYREVLRHGKNNVKFERELTCQLKIDLRNLTNFDPST